jgi:predicted kinase
MLIVFSGLPGVGKTTIARELACSLAAVYLRIDSIEQALRQAGLAVEAEGTPLPMRWLPTTCVLARLLSQTA